MRNLNRTHWLYSVSMIILLMAARALSAGESNVSTDATPARIGVYDSRAVAYAWFWSKGHQTQLDQQRSAVKAAQSAGDTNSLTKLGKALGEEQHAIHQQVFGTAAAANAMDAIQKRLPGLQKQTGVSLF